MAPMRLAMAVCVVVKPRLGQMRSLLSRPSATVRRPPKWVDPFYEGQAWRAFAREIKRQRGMRCEALGCDRDCTAAPRGLIADHIVERRDGGADFDPLNVRLLCVACHNRKTARAASVR